MAETIEIEYRVFGIERIPGSGRLAALAIVEIELGGVPITLQGVRVLRDAAGALTVAAPAFRDGAGVWRSAVILPDTLRDALGVEVMQAFTERR